MTKSKIIFFSIIIAVILSFFVCTAVNAKTGDTKRGKILFSDPKLGDGSTDDSCNTCHYNRNGLEKSGEKKEFTVMGSTVKSLDEAINMCINNVLSVYGPIMFKPL